MSICLSVRPSVRPYEISRLPLEDFHEILYLSILENLSKKFKFHYKLTRIMCTLLEELHVCTFTRIRRCIPFKMRNVSDIICRENHNIHFMVNNFFFQKSRLLRDNVENYAITRQATDENTTRRRKKCISVPDN